MFGATLDGTEEWVDPAVRGAGYIDTIGVVPEARGHGVGSTLLASTTSAMRRIGLTRAILRVNEDNERAMRLYRRFGFRACRKHVVYSRPTEHP